MAYSPFSSDGKIGVFESNSIMGLVARLKKNNNNIYGSTLMKHQNSSFLDASLLFAKSSQNYLLSINNNSITIKIRNELKKHS